MAKVINGNLIKGKEMAETAERVRTTMSQINDLGFGALHESLEVLIQAFNRFPEPEDSESFETELETAVNDLVILHESSDPSKASLLHRLRIKISGFNIWKHRAYRLDERGERIYWNPLDCPFIEFAAIGDVTITIADTEFPARDIIRSWCNEHLRI